MGKFPDIENCILKLTGFYLLFSVYYLVLFSVFPQNLSSIKRGKTETKIKTEKNELKR